MQPLSGFNIISLAINVPGPVAAAELRDLGATVCKIEPPAGDPLAQFSQPWYERLSADMEVITLDLKSSAGITDLESRLESTDLLLTATRPAALNRLGLDWPQLHARHPRLCHAGIIGYPHPHENRAGHDLTYQAAHDTLQPPGMPKVLLADMAGAQRAVTTAVGLLLARERGQDAAQAWVALSEAAEQFAVTIREGITTPGGILGNGLATYNIYATQDGHIALAALEPHFHTRLLDAIGESSTTREALSALFLSRPNIEWVGWAEEHEIPLAEVR
jgi:alpha-methylacyl-CoA racemase